MDEGRGDGGALDKRGKRVGDRIGWGIGGCRRTGLSIGGSERVGERKKDGETLHGGRDEKGWKEGGVFE